MGAIFWNAGQVTLERRLYGGTIGAGSTVDALLSSPSGVGWASGVGFLSYADITGRDWGTRFELTQSYGERLVIKHDPPEAISRARLMSEFPQSSWAPVTQLT